MSSGASPIVRIVRAEWTKLRSVASTPLLFLATVTSTVAFGLLVCSAVDTSGGAAGCVPGLPGCGDEDVVLNSLSGAYLGQIPALALGVLFAASEFATGTIRSTFAAMPRRGRVILAKAGVVAGSIVAAGTVAGALAFLLGQSILHGNGFVTANGYPPVSIGDPAPLRAIIGTSLYLATVSVLGLATGALLRRAGAAIALSLGLLYGPAIVSLLVADPIRGSIQRFSPMMAGLAVQRTVERADSVPIGQWAGLGVATAFAVVLLGAAILLAPHRDA